ncbi:MAG: hypothetical protein AMJ75_00335 [Phycisphaerae bacterium SM1_79]|nr:MAG: hypothetical protein AMJ75_00335 [Phycisphaerae bacterium SM1_79]
MTLGCASMITEVQELAGRSGDTVLITSDRCMRWLNDAQDEIVRRCPGLPDTETDDRTSLTCVSDDVTYSLASFDPTVCHCLEVWYMDGDQSKKLKYLPPDEFETKYPDPTSGDYTPDKPVYWTVQGKDLLKIVPRPSSDEAGDTLRVLYTGYADDFSAADATRASDINHVHQMLVDYGLWQAWGAIGDEGKSTYHNAKFEAGLIKFQEYYGLMPAWIPNIYDFDSIE